ncbi:MAG: glutamine--tRNA ligase, partial [Caldilinea sp.]|nr:glutamine--tRNA ligase [Caldilinea sp.]
DPRMPTIAGLRRRGYTPEAIRLFCQRIGVDKTNSRVQIEVLENAIRDDLNARAPRVMAVLRPLKITITNFPADKVEWLDASYWPRDIDKTGSRQVPLTREIYIERSDFDVNPPADFTRLSPGGEVRLRNAYFIRCDEVVTDPASGEVTELRCTYDPDSMGKPSTAGRRRSTAIQWVSAAHALPAEVRLYSRLFTVANPDEVEEGKTFKDYLNPQSVEVVSDALVEPSLAAANAGERFQFLRHGYFIVDEDTQPGRLVFNRIVELPDSYSGKRGGDDPAPKAEPARQAAAPEPVESIGSLSEGRERARQADAELAARYTRYQEDLGLAAEQADILTGSRDLADFFETALGVGGSARTVANLITNDVQRELKDKSVAELPFTATYLGELAQIIDAGTINSNAAKTVYAEMAAGGGSPKAIVTKLGLDQSVDASELEAIIAGVLAGMPDKVGEYRGGKTSLLGMFTGQVMRATGNKADPKQVQQILKRQLEA